MTAPLFVPRQPKRRRAERRVELLHGDGGMATLCADLPAEIASAAYARIDRHARALRRGGDVRTTSGHTHATKPEPLHDLTDPPPF